MLQLCNGETLQIFNESFRNLLTICNYNYSWLKQKVICAYLADVQ